MRKAMVIQRFERRMRQLGCPPRKLRRYVEELDDHYEALKQAALAEGLAEAEAEARASQLLGEPVAMAEKFAAGLRQSSWFGRHRVLAFCVLPPLGIFAASVLGLVVVIGLLRFFYSADEWRALAGAGDGFNPIALGVKASWYLAIGLTTFLFCWIARRTAAGMQWALIACAACALQSFFGFCRVFPHSTTIGYSTSLNWHCPLIPLAIGVLFFALQRRTQARVADFRM